MPWQVITTLYLARHLSLTSHTWQCSATATIGWCIERSRWRPPTPSFLAKSPRTSTRPSNFVFKPGDGPMHCCSPKAKVSLCVLARRISSKWAAVADINGAILGKKDLADLVHGSEVGEWREMLVVLGRWVEADSFASLVGELGERLWATEEEKREAARVCCMAGKKLERLVAIWGEEAKKEEDQDGNFVGFIASDRGSNAGTYPLAPLHDLFLEYAQILSVQRMASEAGAFEKKAEVKPALATTSTTAGQYAANHGVGSYDGRNPPPASAGPYSTPLPLRVCLIVLLLLLHLAV
ncbi:unnamed protein product [Rhizoctonia solani]|uniref:Uncharacterized protein n=1 Tax=Rhizoctonia solani TaxID=456999 RepID=A0A8H2XZZ6_9AGAM|nr:unnamed protein product [Rhizoctonia solani]